MVEANILDDDQDMDNLQTIAEEDICDPQQSVSPLLLISKAPPFSFSMFCAYKVYVLLRNSDQQK